MSRLGLATLLLAPALACGPADPGGSAGSTGDSTAQTGGSTGTSASTGGATEPTSGGTGTGTSAGSTTGAPDTTSTASTDGTSASTGVTPGTSSGSSGDTGGPLSCGIADGDYGDCDAVLGAAFDGTECTVRSGCDCAPDCDKFFPDPASCALTCAAAGHCNEDRIKAAGIASDPIGPGDLCDEIDVCPDQNGTKPIFEKIFDMLSCQGGDYPCKGAETCTGLWQNMLGPDEWETTCAASLVENSGDIFCVVWGP